MASPEQPPGGTTTRPPQQRPAQRQSPTTSAQHSANVMKAATKAAKQSAKDMIFENRPYLKYAFTNPYNLSLLGGALAAAGITLNPFLALIALGLEGLWLLYAPDSGKLKKILWDPRFEELRIAMEAKERAERIKNLAPNMQMRVENLAARQHEINHLASRNPSFTADLLKTELVKTGKLVDAFIEMAITSSRYEEYLESIDVGHIERDRARWEREVRAGKNGEPQTEIAKKNFAIILKRLEKITEIKHYLSVARGQLDLLENSFELIADQIVTMNSPTELSGQLDELLNGVESIKESAADTEKLLSSLGL